MISYLFLADDSLLFCRASRADCEAILQILSTYEAASGQQVNRDKTKLFFSKSTPHSVSMELINLLGVPAIQEYENTWGSLLLLGDHERKVSSRSRKKFGLASKVGSRNSSPRPVEKC